MNSIILIAVCLTNPPLRDVLYISATHKQLITPRPKQTKVISRFESCSYENPSLRLPYASLLREKGPPQKLGNSSKCYDSSAY